MWSSARAYEGSHSKICLLSGSPITTMDVLFQSPATLLKQGVPCVETAQVSTPPADRPLLSRWFRILNDRVRLSDRHRLNSQKVRVESSTASDWWIHVHPKGLKRHENCGFFGHHACLASAGDEVALYKELREALLVTTMLARIDYSAWYEGMKTTSGLRLTKEQREERVECKFAFTLEGGGSPELNGWRDKIATLWGLGEQDLPAHEEQFSEEFLSSAVALCAMARSKNVKWHDVIKPLPVRFEYSEAAATPEKQGAALDSVTNTIRQTQLNRAKKGEGVLSLLPSFELQTVELYLWRHDAHPAVFSALERLLETNVQIDFLALPGRYNRDSVDEESLEHAWRSLARKLFTSSRPSKDAEATTVQVDRLEIASVYLIPALNTSWLQSLKTTTNVRSLSIQGQVSPLLSTSGFWRHIASAFFSHHATNSIQSLELAGLGDISADAVAGFESVITENQVDAHNHAQAALRTLVLSLAPGPQPTPGLDGSLHVGPKQWIPRILQLGGKILTSLAIDRADVDDVLLHECLHACPNLENLRINGATLQSLDALVETYDRPDQRQLTSIELRTITIPIDAFETFLSALSDEKKAIYSTLSRLRVGEGWSSTFRKSTVTALEDLLNTNRTLATVQVYRSAGPFSSIPVADWDRLKTHDGSFLAKVDSPLQLESRLAFLGSLRRLSANKSVPVVAEDPLRMIIELAAKARRRSVLIFTDVDQIQY